jgi:hypothetical protein
MEKYFPEFGLSGIFSNDKILKISQMGLNPNHLTYCNFRESERISAGFLDFRGEENSTERNLRENSF